METENNKKEDESKIPYIIVGWAVVIGIFVFIFSNFSPTTPDTTTTSNTFYTQNPTTNVRSCESTSCDKIGTYSINTSFTLPYATIADLPDWVQVSWTDTTGNTQNGYISKTTLGQDMVASGGNTDTAPDSSTPPAQTSTVSSQPLGLPALIQEWQKSTAYVECYWDNPNTGTWYQKESGSGLLVRFTSGYTVITNRHVVDSPTYGLANECDFGFHDDNTVYYSIITTDRPAHYFPGTSLVVPDTPAYGDIGVNTDGTDVATLSNFKQENDSPTISIANRAQKGHFSCDSVPTGEPIVVLGYPDYGAGAGTYTSIFSNLSVTATEGIISGQDGIYLTTSAKLDPGNSGGLAIDENNDCYVGIPTAAVLGSMSSLGRILPAKYTVSYSN